jgi:deoxyguanosine kinase
MMIKKLLQFKINYIAIEGCIGVGKTTLCQSFSNYINGKAILEEINKNPYLDDFYKKIKKTALKTQLFFLLSRYKQQLKLTKQYNLKKIFISDYMIFKDQIFSKLTLNNEEILLYKRLFSILYKNIVIPNFIIYLRAPINIINNRIKKRGRIFEQNIEQNYLMSLIKAYDNFFYNFSKCPILIAETKNFHLGKTINNVNFLINEILFMMKHKKNKHIIKK